MNLSSSLENNILFYLVVIVVLERKTMHGNSEAGKYSIHIRMTWRKRARCKLWNMYIKELFSSFAKQNNFCHLWAKLRAMTHVYLLLSCLSFV